MSWPESLAREIAESRCIFHLGSGLSCQSVDEKGKRPLGWSVLLSELKDRILPEEHQSLAQSFIEEKKFLDAAEIIRTHGRQADFNSIITEEFFSKTFIPSISHNTIVEISPKIIVTTNYDSIIESALIDISGNNSFHSFEYNTDGLIDAIRSPANILLKLHGCAQHTRNVILSRSDYFKLRDQYNVSFEIVTSLYKINTVLFIGCGIEDPDINLILENIRLRIGSSSPSYALVGSLSYAAKMKDSIKNQYNIELIIYDQANENDHSNFELMLIQLKDKVEEVKAKYGL